MFNRYNINDLYLAYISVMYPDVKISGNYEADIEYCYTTILRKVGEKYIDLQSKNKKITTKRNPNETSYIIEYMEPLGKYYTQDGEKKEYFDKNRVVNLLRQHYNKFREDYNESIKQKTKSLKK